MDAQRPQRRILPCRAPRPGRISSGAALRRPSTPINIFRFLDLPGELRNAVYEEIAASTDTVVFRNGSPVPPPLSRVCRQVRSEFLSVLNSDVFSPTTVDVRVKDFDFASVYATIKQMRHIIPPPGQKLRLNVLIDWITPGAEYRPSLVNWLECLTAGHKRYKAADQSAPGQPIRVCHTVRVPSHKYITRFHVQGDGAWLCDDKRMGEGIDFRRLRLMKRMIFRAIGKARVAPAPRSELKRMREEPWLGWAVPLDERKGKRRRLEEDGSCEFIAGFSGQFYDD